MNTDFSDITEVMGTPLWYDRIGYPRYCAFHPKEHSNIYASYIALVEIECQSCSHPFTVAVALSGMDRLGGIQFPKKEDIGSFHYGDPPNHDCVGDTMNVSNIEVLEFWKRGTANFKWKRVKKYEVKVDEGY